ncbi:MAG: 2-amino-4-hydroxy-6-hydroxymethyldihydropteridine diphosphokinase [Zetaproteobacteria bacterium]|nr:2-amino-4-hydroxy-6-hydroxymethyldihydropteridine diphosphokinase [Zetaproteobacteria bacterium]
MNGWQVSSQISKTWLALGGNIGNVLHAFQTVRKSLEKHPSCHILTSSLLYQTPPMGPEGQADYLNAALHLETSLSPIDLLDVLQHLEQQHGRVRHEHWGARTIDLDIIAYDDISMDSERLILPHQHMHCRQFVLRPMCDISPYWLHPNQQKTARELLQAILSTGHLPLSNGQKW